MKIINQKIYLTMKEAVECGFNENYIRKAKSIGTNAWDLIDDPDDKRKVLVGYDGLTNERKRLVDLRFGNVYEYMVKAPILDMVLNDWKAEEYYRSYKHNGNNLELRTINKYIREAGWLNMINGTDNYSIKKLLNIPVETFKNHVAELVRLEKERGKDDTYTGIDIVTGSFPSSAQRLWNLAGEFKLNGYDLLIDARMGNKNSAKLGKVVNIGQELIPELTGNVQKNSVDNGYFDSEIYQQQMAAIRYLCGLHNNLDAAQVMGAVNIVFEQKGWKTVGRATIARFIKENRELLTPGRHGKRAFMNQVAMQVKRKPPKWAMLYWTLDGWTVELTYREAAKGGTVFNRFVVVVVLDPFNKYPVGYAIGERETPELIKEALRNAVQHTYELFGDSYIPMQLQSDNYQIKNLTPFYQATTKLFTPAAVGNSKGKVIEPYFMYLNKKYCQTERNWSGFNVDASKD